MSYDILSFRSYFQSKGGTFLRHRVLFDADVALDKVKKKVAFRNLIIIVISGCFVAYTKYIFDFFFISSWALEIYVNSSIRKCHC